MTDNKKAKHLSKEEIKTKLLDSITIDKVLECEDLRGTRPRRSSRDN